MRYQVFCVLAVTAVCLAMATSAQADYISEVAIDAPFLWMQLDETSVTNGMAAANSGSTGVGGTYQVNPANGTFIDVTSPVGPAKDFNVINFGGVLEPDILLSDQGGYYAMSAYTVEFLLNPTAYAGEQMIYSGEGWLANLTQVGLGTSSAGYGVYTTMSGQSHITFDISAQAPVGEWSHVVLTNSISDNGDGTSTSDIDVYVDGAFVAGAAPVWFRAAGQGTATFGNLARMGDFFATGTSSFDSGLDEFAVYDGVLSLERIQAHAAAVSVPALLGDLDGSGFVDMGDIDVLGSFWGQTVEQGNPAQGDPSNDGFVGAADLDIVRADWGNGTPSGSSVPEPSMLMLLVTAATVGLLWRFPTRITASMQNTSERL